MNRLAFFSIAERAVFGAPAYYNTRYKKTGIREKNIARSRDSTRLAGARPRAESADPSARARGVGGALEANLGRKPEMCVCWGRIPSNARYLNSSLKRSIRYFQRYAGVNGSPNSSESSSANDQRLIEFTTGYVLL